jgi:hypothetical protein
MQAVQGAQQSTATLCNVVSTVCDKGLCLTPIKAQRRGVASVHDGLVMGPHGVSLLDEHAAVFA